MSAPQPHDYRSILAPLIAQVGQSRAAELAGLKQPNISAWLAGKRALPVMQQLRLAEALGCRVTWPRVEPPREPSSNP